MSLADSLPRWIDVSNNNGFIDWPSVASSGIVGAIAKASQGDYFTDPYFPGHWSAMRANQMKRGAYHFADGDVSPEIEARYFLDRVNLAGGFQPGDIAALDMETEGTADMSDWCVRWLDYVRDQVGFAPMLYTAPGFMDSLHLTGPGLAEFPLWLATWPKSGIPTIDNMPSTPAPWKPGDIAIWQYSDKGRVPGIVGDVDLDLFVGDLSKEWGKPSGHADDAPSTDPPVRYQYVLGFADVVARLGRDLVGEPLENEHDTEVAGHAVRHQLTTHGQLIYWKDAGYAGYYPPITG